MKQKKKVVRLGLDIDGVIYRWPDTVRYLLKTHWNIDNVPFEGRIEDHLPKQANDWIWKEGVEDHGLFRYGSIYKGSRDFLMKIKDISQIVVITRRPTNALQDTLDWLSYQKLPANEIHILDWKKPKSSIEPQCDIYIDDETGNALDFIANTSAKVIMPDRLWNQKMETHERLFRTYTWKEIEKIIKLTYRELHTGD